MAQWILFSKIRPSPLGRSHLLDILSSNTPQLEINVLSTISYDRNWERKSDRAEQGREKQELLKRQRQSLFSPKMVYHGKQQFGNANGQRIRETKQPSRWHHCAHRREGAFSKVLNSSSRRKTSSHRSSWDRYYTLPLLDLQKRVFWCWIDVWMEHKAS